jgi:phosphomevalonate kinase
METTIDEKFEKKLKFVRRSLTKMTDKFKAKFENSELTFELSFDSATEPGSITGKIKAN